MAEHVWIMVNIILVIIKQVRGINLIERVANPQAKPQVRPRKCKACAPMVEHA